MFLSACFSFKWWCSSDCNCFWCRVVAGASSLRTVIPSGCLLKSSRACFGSIELEILLCSVLKVQRWWKGVLLLKLRAKSAVIIQSHIRAWFARRNAAREKHHIVFIQVRYSSFFYALLYILPLW